MKDLVRIGNNVSPTLSVNNTLNYKGLWNANTNNPTLVSGGGNGIKNDFYIIDTAGSTSLDGHNSWNPGDWILNNGIVWDRLPAFDAVSEVAGKTGFVVLVKNDVSDFVEGDYVHVTGDENVGGIKTFTSIPILPALDPTTDNQATRKKFVSDLDAANVKLTGDQTVGGIKTFSFNPVLSGSDPVGSTEATKKGYVDDLDSANVKLTGDQSIAGVKTYSSILVLPAIDPTTDNQAVRKKYNDDQLSAGLATKENTLSKGSLLGTSNQIIVVNGNNAVIGSGTTLSTPQDIATTSKPTFAGAILTDDLTLPKTSGKGIMIDSASPTFGWKDLIGNFIPDQSGLNAPTLAAFIGGTYRGYAYTVSDKIDIQFHMLHDYVPGTDIFLHIHWAHNGTAISGHLICSFAYTYSKGHNQANYFTEKTILIDVSTPNIATIPQYRHRIDEVQLSSATPDSTQMLTSLLEPDGIIGMTMTVTTLPTITGGSTNRVFISFVDIHYQSTQLATKQKAPNFYV